nr:glycosyltransferase family 1 protein [Desulfobacterales bacterium]
MRLLIFNQKTDLTDSGLGVAIDWITAFSRCVEKVYVITHEAGVVPTLPSVKILSIGKEKGYGRIQRFLEFYRLLLSTLSRNQIDGCFVHMVPIFAVLASPILKWKHIPMVQWYAHKETPWSLRVAHRLVNRIVTASKESFRLPSQKVVVTGHGIDTDRFIPPKQLNKLNKPFTILSVGRISPIKRYEILLKAVALVHKAGKECKVLLVGGTRTKRDEEYLQHLQMEVEQLKLGSYIQFVGPIPRHEVLYWYWKADIFVNLSDTDSVDKAVLEAMSCGLPSITSNISFQFMPRDVIQELLVPKGDVSALAKAIIRVSEWDPDYREQVCRRLRQIVIDQHDLNHFVHKVIQLFNCK